MPSSDSLRGCVVRVKVPVLVGTQSVVRTVSARVLIDLSTRFIVLTEAEYTEGKPMLFSVEEERTSLATQKVESAAMSKAECVSMLAAFLATKPDVDLVGVYFPFMDYVRQGELYGETHQAIVLYNAEEEGTAVMLANFLNGYHVERSDRIPLQPNHFMLGGQVAHNPPVSSGDVDVVKLFSLPVLDGSGNDTYWDWKMNKRVLKLRNGHGVRDAIVQRLLALAESDPLEYVEVDREKVGRVRASQVLIQRRDGECRRVHRVVIMQSGV
ncbi:expressed unknown protein [Seminavis robusta]|uniref:Uncharacterized protein n=1 Tax=Seminavis robusta TaxID=568900 RepID=A0A9N8D553_9STRA|nr:expressed unknown protein [Seminavis robusta]|eukprot:Sro6_g005640.1 n/a (269) ;mRNA; f:266269-267075